MKTLLFSEFDKTGNLSYDIFRAIQKCKSGKYSKLIFPKGTYKIDDTFCFQKSLNISNHGLNGPKRIAFLLDGLNGFEIDFCGSTVITDGVVIPLAIVDCKNIKVKNITVDNPDTNMLQGKVVETGSNYAKLELMTGKCRFFIENGKVWAHYGREYLYIRQDSVIEIKPETGEIEYGTGDSPFGANSETVYEEVGDKYLVLHNLKRVPKVGNIVITHAYCRCATGTLIDRSENITLENYTVNACFGMGLLGQFSKDITLNGFNLLRRDGRFYTATADATHFVCCTGTVKVENSTFENQLDDALNIHGMFLRVVQKLCDKELLIKQMHCQATGLPVVSAGDNISVVKSDTLLPYAKKTVESFEYINDEILRIKFVEEVGDIEVGDNLENITKNADLIFMNNTVRNNRGRGMLIATKGKVLIENNYFHTPGASLYFESDSKWWFEAGGTTDITVKDNFFDRCKYGKWGNAVIEFVKREKEEKDRFYHGKVKIVNNKFDLTNQDLAVFDNIAEVVFKDNEINCENGSIKISHCKKTDIQSDGVRTE